jgi:hypothetical protein
MAQAAAAMQQQAAAAASATQPSPLPAASPGVHLPAVSCGHTFQRMPNQMGQQLPLDSAQMDVLNLWGPLQQPGPWQQPQQVTGSMAAQQGALHMSMVAQQQQQQQQPPPPLLQPLLSAAGPSQAPSIFADMPVDDLPLAMHPSRQVKTFVQPYPSCP